MKRMLLPAAVAALFTALPASAELTATIKRSDFGVKIFLPAVADDVVPRINVEAIKD